MKNDAIVADNGRVSWRAIFAGAIVALSIHLLLTTLGGGITAFFARPSASDAPGKILAIGTALAWTVGALISLWVGGCVAGTLAANRDSESGKLHGFLVWSLATVVTFLLFILGLGGAVARAAGLAGATVAAAGKVPVEAAPDLTREAAEIIDGYAGEVTTTGKLLTPAGKRELARSVKNLLTGPEAERPANREALINVLMTSGSMNAADATKTVDEWIKSYDRTMQEFRAAADAAAKKASEIADRAAVATGAAAIWTFVAFWTGAAAAVWGGWCGGGGLRRERVADPVRTAPG